MELKINKSAVVITPSIGAPTLGQAYQSVLNQTNKQSRHLIVADGYPACEGINKQLLEIGMYRGKVDTDMVSKNVGFHGYYGHRIYAAWSHLVDEDYVFFLDEDNWFDPTHIDDLIEVMDESNADIGYSLRKIVDESGNFICDDNCESLGPSFSELIDTSAFCFRNSFIRSTGHLWDNKWGADRAYLSAVMQLEPKPKIVCTKKHTLNYRCGSNAGSVTPHFFLEGNEKVKEQLIKQNLDFYPWSETKINV